MTGARLDRLVSLYLFHPLSTLSLTTPQIPVLMYHTISSSPARKPQARYFQTNTDPALFERQIRFLHENGYQSINLETLNRFVSGEGRRWTGRYVCITFDDGYLDFHTKAFPILAKFGLRAAVFLTTSLVGRHNFLSWRAVRELINEGIEFGSHTVNHLQLRSLSKESILDELWASKEEIESRTGHPVYSFSYPLAFPAQDRRLKGTLKNVLEECGYRSALNSLVGTVKVGDDPFFLKRIPIDSLDTEPFFKAKLEGAYNWFYIFQRIRKIGQYSRGNKREDAILETGYEGQAPPARSLTDKLRSGMRLTNR